MKKLILAAALGSTALLLSACGDSADDTDVVTAEETGAVETVDTGPAATTAAADPNWPSGTRIVVEDDVTYRIDPAGTRVAIEDGSYRVVTENGVRYRVSAEGVRHRIDDDGLDIDLPAVEGVDIDVGTNTKGNLDVDVSTDGSDASRDRPAN